MISRPNSDLKAFYEFVGIKVQSEPTLTPQEVLAEWLDEEDWITTLDESIAQIDQGLTHS